MNPQCAIYFIEVESFVDFILATEELDLFTPQ